MKKTFPLQAPGLVAARVIEAIKYDVRKYVKRERGKKLPEGFDTWDFSCKVGASAVSAEAKPLDEVGPAIDEVAKLGAPGVYVEIVATPGHRAPRIAAVSTASAAQSPAETADTPPVSE